jgi:hypothetical protein
VGGTLYGADTHYWSAWQNAPDTIQNGTYIGDNTIGRTITIPGVTVLPNRRSLWIKGEVGSNASGTMTNSLDAGDTHIPQIAHATDAVQSMAAGGFVIDDRAHVNADTVLFHYLMMQTGDGILNFNSGFGDLPDLEPIKWEFFSYYFDEYQQFKGNNSLSETFRRIKL